MKKILGLLTLVLLSAGISAAITFFVLSNQYAHRRSNDQDAYEQQIDKLEAKVAQLEGSMRQTPSPSHTTPSGVSASTAASANSRPNTLSINPQRPTTVVVLPGSENSAGAGQLQTPALPIAASPALVPPTVIQPVSDPMVSGPMVRYEATTTGSKCQIDGTSSIHPWNMASPILGGSFEVASTLDPTQALPPGVAEDGRLKANALVTIPVRSLKSYSTAMDDVYMDHMEAAKFRRIEYRLKALVLKTPHAPNTPFEFDSVGELTVHGVTNLIAMPVKIERLDATSLKISGATALKMSTYKVEPPSPTIAGVKITTGDDINVTFQWSVKQAATTIVQ